MASKDDYDDDYVASLLAQDAKKASRNYASQGVSALFPPRRAADAPKPNTRFLSHIVREADHHNAALKRKEEREADRRLRALRGDDEPPPRKRRRADESDDSKRKRVLNDILGAARDGRDLSSRKQKGDDHARHEQSRRNKKALEHRPHDRPGHEHKHQRRRRNSSSSLDDESQGELDRRTRRRSQQDRHKSRRRSISTDKSPRPSAQAQSSRPGGTTDDHERVCKRGRGAFKQRSGMDDRFADDYDPSQDVSLDSEPDNDEAEDWDMALEAMRDRAKYRKSQANRMREAGFDERDIAKWEKGLRHDPAARDGDVTSVKWSMKGEIREWDAGKTRK